MRPDGTRVKDLPPLVAAIPYIMPKRYDAWNSVTENIDEEIIKDFIRTHRRAGVRMNHMERHHLRLLQGGAAQSQAELLRHERPHLPPQPLLRVLRDPEKTGQRGSQRDHAEGVSGRERHSVYRESENCRRNCRQSGGAQSNSTDKFAKFMFSVPGLPKFVVWLAYHLDRHGLLPRKIIELSPFHTSMFITNLASIKTSYIHHHCYEFGTTSVFVCMGKPVPNYISGDLTRKMMPIGVVMDERICTGYEYAAFCNDFRRYMRLPQMLEYPFCQEEPEKKPAAETAAGITGKCSAHGAEHF